jgi:hypothetical protein
MLRPRLYSPKIIAPTHNFWTPDNPEAKLEVPVKFHVDEHNVPSILLQECHDSMLAVTVYWPADSTVMCILVFPAVSR